MLKTPEERPRCARVVWWWLLALTVLAGCGKRPLDTAPTALEFGASSLYQFATRLKAMPEDQRGAAVRQFLLQNPASPLVEGTNLVGILWYGRAQQVSINGDLQHAWTKPEPLDAIACGEDTFFYCLQQAPHDARVDYLLKVDGKDTIDPRNPRLTPSGYGPHSEIAMPGYKPNPARRFREGIPHGTVDSISFTNRIPPLQPRGLKVYRPAAYDGSARLPTLYVYDGLEALDYMAYTNVLDNLIVEGKIPPVLVVFIEMLPEDIQLFPDKLTALTSMVCDEIVPLIDGAYRTVPAPSGRAVAGISAWGNLALTTAFSRPDLFLLAAGQSTTVTDSLMHTFLRPASRSHPPSAFRLYLDVGNYDLTTGAMGGLTFLQANQLLRKELERRGTRLRYQVLNDGHQWANWRERTDAILRYLFPSSTD